MESINPHQKEHPVETQWHYKILTKYGFNPITKSDKGFVRKYIYTNSSGKKIICSTGVNADHWSDPESGKGGYWSDLENYCLSL